MFINDINLCLFIYWHTCPLSIGIRANNNFREESSEILFIFLNMLRPYYAANECIYNIGVIAIIIRPIMHLTLTISFKCKGKPTSTRTRTYIYIYILVINNCFAYIRGSSSYDEPSGAVITYYNYK